MIISYCHKLVGTYKSDEYLQQITFQQYSTLSALKKVVYKALSSLNAQEHAKRIFRFIKCCPC